MKKIFKFLTTLAFGLMLLGENRAQQVSIKPFSINSSNLIGDLKALKSSNPNISSEDFAKASNALLEKQGINFVVGLDPNTCQKIEQVRKSQKNPNAPLNLRATLKSPLGESAALALPEADFSKNQCFSCFINLSFLEITDKDFVTIVEGSNLKFFLPANFLVNEVALVDEKDLMTVVRKWRIPFKTDPVSVSDDGNILYLGFEEPELAELALAAFGEGVYQIHARKDLDADKKRSVLPALPSGASSPNFSFFQFQSGAVKQIVRSAAKCQN